MPVLEKYENGGQGSVCTGTNMQLTSQKLPLKIVTFEYLINISKGNESSCTVHNPPCSCTLEFAYVYILTHPGHPTIFYDHYMEWGLMEPIKKLTEIRKRNGIKATSTVNILAAEADLYMAEIDNKVVVKIGPKQDLGNLLPPNVEVTTNGQDYAVWERK